MEKTFENVSFSELIERISERLSDFSCEDLEEIASNILDKKVIYQGDGAFDILN